MDNGQNISLFGSITRIIGVLILGVFSYGLWLYLSPDYEIPLEFELYKGESFHSQVTVIDGDTVRLSILATTSVRLIGIDAPEKGECYFEESKEALEELIGKDLVRFDKDISGVDKYGRLLRHAVLEKLNPEVDNIIIGERMVRMGVVRAISSSPDNRYRDLYSSAQQEAIREKRGLWGACEGVVPENSHMQEADEPPPSEDHVIKGNISSKGFGKLYYMPGCPNYNTIKIDSERGDQWFASEAEAKKAGFKRSDSCDNTF